MEKLLLSGDNGRPDDNEPDAMREAALASGVAAEDNETVGLAEERAWTQATFTILASVLAGLGAASLGFAVAGGAG